MSQLRISDCGLRIEPTRQFTFGRDSCPLDLRLWTLDLRTLDLGLWTLDFGPWTLDLGLWTLDFGPWTLVRAGAESGKTVEPPRRHRRRSRPPSGRCPRPDGDRKSTRLNSSHLVISYAVFCLKKKKTTLRD